MDFLLLLQAPAFSPFTAAAFFILLMLLIEIMLASLGISSMDNSDADVDFEPVIDADFDADLGADFETAFGEPEIDAHVPATPSGNWGLFDFGRVPLTVLLISLAAGFAIVGFAIQFSMLGIFGFPLYWWIAVPVAMVLGFFIARVFSRVFANAVPRESTQAVNLRSLGGSTGVITVGTATTTSPAMAKVTDRNGNHHRIRVVPYTNEPPLPEGAKIVAIRGKHNRIFYAMDLQKARLQYNRSH